MLRQLALLVLWGCGLMAAALPLCRILEKKLPPGVSALLALMGVGAAVLLLALLVLPAVLRQGREVMGLLPQAWAGLSPLMALLPLDHLARWLAEAMGGLWQRLTAVTAGLGRFLPAPALAFYFLRDRVSIARELCLWAPLGCRARAVRAAREARRELLGYLRGQALTCLSVGALTAVGLLLAGLPAWLLLGLFMGLMEAVPYLGPLVAALPILLFALPRGTAATLWALAVVLAVQQAEGSVLSPRLMAGATRLHPAWVLLIISLGGMTAGLGGMLLALPLTVTLRGAVRGYRAG